MKRSWRVVELRLSSGHMNLPRWTAIITHHTAGLDKLGSLNSEGSGAQVRWAAPEQRCCTGTPSKIHPSTHAMKLTAWARLVAPATRAGRSTTSPGHELVGRRPVAAAHERMQPHRSRTLREPTSHATVACRWVVAVPLTWVWPRQPAGRTGVAAFASGDTLVRTPYCYWAPGTFLERSERLGLERVLGTFRTQAVCRSGKLSLR